MSFAHSQEKYNPRVQLGSATFGLPEWHAEQLELETKSIPLSFVLGILLVSEKGPETHRHYFELTDVLDLGERMVSV